MPRNAPEQLKSGSSVALVEHALPQRAREERLARIVGAISRRLGRWVWADIHRRVRNTVRQIFALWLEHPSAAAVRNGLKALGLSDRKGRVWSTSALEWMIANPVYVGDVRDGEIVRPGIHEALVTGEVWDAAQRLLPTRTRLAPSTYKRAYPLKGASPL